MFSLFLLCINYIIIRNLISILFFNINVKKRVIPQIVEENNVDEELEKINELFGDDIKITEE